MSYLNCIGIFLTFAVNTSVVCQLTALVSRVLKKALNGMTFCSAHTTTVYQFFSISLQYSFHCIVFWYITVYQKDYAITHVFLLFVCLGYKYLVKNLTENYKTWEWVDIPYQISMNLLTLTFTFDLVSKLGFALHILCIFAPNSFKCGTWCYNIPRNNCDFSDLYHDFWSHFFDFFCPECSWA